MKLKYKLNHAFTLVEILIVVAIIALLAAVAIPNLLRARINANESSAKATLKTIANALENYYASNSQYPTDPNDLIGITPPYLNDDYFTGPHSGYTFSHALSQFSYSVTASPVTLGSTGSTTFTIITGAIYQ